jgi:hypothetical protein
MNAYVIETLGGEKMYKVSALKPEEFAASKEGYQDPSTCRVLTMKDSKWRLVPRPKSSDPDMIA